MSHEIDPRFKKRFFYRPTIEDALNGGGVMVCIAEQYTEQKIVENEVVKKASGSILFPPFLLDKGENFSVNSDFVERSFRFSSNPTPDPENGIGLTLISDGKKNREAEANRRPVIFL